TRQALSVMNPQDEDEKSDPDRVQAHAAMREVFEITDRVCALRTEDVVWVSESERGERSVHVAPLSVSGLLRQHVLTTATTILTSATLKIGGELGPAARDVGLSSQEYIADEAPEVMETQLGWRGLDVGSPFDYARQGIMFVGRSLPRPGRDQMPHEVLDALVQLVQAAGGRTLGLFASQRNAEAAAQYVREHLHDLTILRQGEGHLAELTRRFTAEPQTCLFGTMSLWQGVDVPGDTCRLVVIDKIPFPRPDDPLVLARSQAVEEAGGNGFMAISARRAALLLAQGAGRLIRRSDDRGVVAVLDPRLSTARYAGYLRKSMPQFWMTTDLSTTLAALRRLGQ
ncbi:MAG: ATP-dependent DNA helicase, partial [Cutibacterium granulosum]|nr:ATP-dependent DNA helicase [Cutibacterium granulosum]